LVGYGIGALDLESMFGASQFKLMILFATTGLLVAVGVTSYAVTERVLISDGYISPFDVSCRQLIRKRVVRTANLELGLLQSLLRSSKRLRIRRLASRRSAGSNSGHGLVSLMQSSAKAMLITAGWFPFLFYSPTWVGEM